MPKFALFFLAFYCNLGFSIVFEVIRVYNLRLAF